MSVRSTLFLLWGGVLFVLADWRGQHHQPRAHDPLSRDARTGDAPRARRGARRG